MSTAQKKLWEIAQQCPDWMFNVEEIALLCNVSRDFVTKVKYVADSPFCLHVCRPEWFTAWLRTHRNFQLSKDPKTKKKNNGTVLIGF